MRFAIVVVMALVAILAGPAAAQAPVTIRGLVVDSFARIWEERLVPEFNKRAPHIKVEIDAAPYGELLPKQMLELTRKPLAYDFLVTDDPWVPQLANTGLLAPLKDAFRDATRPDYDWADFHPAPLAAGEWKGVQYGVPVRSNLLLMFYNRDLFRKAGVAEPGPSFSWDDFEKTAAALTKGSQWGFDTYFARHQLTPTIWQAVLNSNGGSLFDAAMKPTFNTPAGAAALEAHLRFLKYAPPGAETHEFPQMNEAFRQGRVAIMFNWGSVYRTVAVDPKATTVKLGDGGIAALPRGSLAHGSHRGIWIATVPKDAPHRAAAWEFVQWISSKEGERFSAATIGSFPARKSTLTGAPPEPWLADVYKAIFAGYEGIAAGKMWRPRLPESDAVQQILALHHSRAVTREVSPKQALDDAAKEVETLLREKGYYK